MKEYLRNYIESGENNNPVPNKSKVKLQRTKIAYGFLAPTILLFLVFTAIPFMLAIYYSFTDFNGVVSPSFVGWDNFVSAFHDDGFMSSMKNVFIFALFYVPLSIITSLVISFLISKVRLKHNIFKIIYYIPSLTSGAAMVFVWKSILASSTTVNFFEGKMAMITIIAISLWSAMGGNMLIYLAAMTGIPRDVYEAAEIDGANKWKQFIHITVPLLRSSTYFIFTTTLIGSFQLFDLVYLLGLYNNRNSITPVVEIYLFAKQYRYGMGSAMSVILFIIIMLITVITQFFVKEKANEKGKLIKHK